MSVTFDPANRRIVLNAGVTSITTQFLYSRWKEWAQDNAQWPEAFRVVGGDPIGGGLFVASYFFLMNSWRVRPQEADHTRADPSCGAGSSPRHFHQRQHRPDGGRDRCGAAGCDEQRAAWRGRQADERRRRHWNGHQWRPVEGGRCSTVTHSSRRPSARRRFGSPLRCRPPILIAAVAQAAGWTLSAPGGLADATKRLFCS
jgi:hypothetical protein